MMSVMGHERSRTDIKETISIINRKKEEMLVPKSRANREAHRTKPDSDMTRVQLGIDRSLTGPCNLALVSTPYFHESPAGSRRCYFPLLRPVGIAHVPNNQNNPNPQKQGIIEIESGHALF